MIKIAIVGCTGKLGSAIMTNALKSTDVEVCYAVARKGNPFVGRSVSELIGGKSELLIIDDIELANNCDIYIDCTNAETAYYSNNCVFGRGYRKNQSIGNEYSCFYVWKF